MFARWQIVVEECAFLFELVGIAVQPQDAIKAEGQVLAGIDACFAIENDGVFRPLREVAPEIPPPALPFALSATLRTDNDRMSTKKDVLRFAHAGLG